MKHKFLLALSFCTLSTFPVYAQKVTMNLNKVKLERVFREITRQTGLTVAYSQPTVNPQRIVSVRAKGRELAEVLNELFMGTGISFDIGKQKIYLKQAQNTNAKKSQASDSRNGKTVRGRIVDSKGEPIIGASVKVNGRTTGAVTDIDGNYTISGVPEGATLDVSYIGFKNAQVKADGIHNANIVLDEDNQQLSEVVVVGYGTQKKVNLTGAVAVVDGNELKDRPVANMTQLLQGAVPNMNITTTNGMPGNSGSINIRGIGSISGSSAPLVLIDGVEGSINDVNPYDVESVSVLKDASAAAVYGARAAYGVILVTTKNGQDGKMHVSYSGMYGFGDLTTKHDFETRGYYATAINDMFFSTYQGGNYTNYTDEDYYELWIRRNDKTENPDRPWVVEKNGRYKYYGNFDWFNYYYDTSRPTWQHNVTVTGGNKKLQYFLSGGMYSQDGILRQQTDNFKRTNYRMKVKAQVNEWLSISNNTTYYRNKYKYPGPAGMNGQFRSMELHALPIFTPTNPDGTAVYRTDVTSYNMGDGLPSVYVKGKNDNRDSHDNFQTTFEAILTPVKHLTVTANYTYYYQHYANMNRSVTIPYSQTPGVVEERTDIKDELFERNQDWWYNGYNVFATYSNTFAKAHTITVTGGTNYETRYYKLLSGQRDNLLSEDLNDFNLAKGDNIVLTGGKERYALLGYFYRVNYDYKNRYLFEASGRYDGSSRFPRHHRYGFFPSFSLGWRVAEEPFFTPLKKYVDNLKVRLSYGSLGNQNVGAYDYLQTINSGAQINYAFGGDTKINGASASAPNASDLTWEKVITYNAGLDLGLLNNRLTFTGDVYIRDTKNMLMASKDLPGVYGASAPKANAANLRTKGYELSASWNDHFRLLNSPFNYSITLGFADSKTKITKYNNPNKTVGTYYEGEELGSIWGYLTDGFFKTDEEARNYKVDQSYVNNIINVSVVDNGLHAGDIKYVDLDGDGVIRTTTTALDLKDKRIIGNSLPRWTYSGKVTLEWKGIGVSAMWQGVVRQHWYPGGESLLFWGPYTRPYQSFIPTDFMSKVWSESNPNAYFPRPRGYVALGDHRELSTPNTMYLQNAGYWRLKNLTVSYDLPKSLIKRVGIEALRVYFSGENLFTISGLDTKYIDPETCTTGYNGKANSGVSNVSGYPMSKTYSFGLNITF